MAALAVGHAHVYRCVRAGPGRRKKTGVAAGALPYDGDASVEARWRPGHKTATMACVAIGDDHARQRLIGNMRRRPRIGRWERATVAGRTLVGDDDLGVIEP